MAASFFNPTLPRISRINADQATAGELSALIRAIRGKCLGCGFAALGNP
jgi:hypothetical protein